MAVGRCPLVPNTWGTARPGADMIWPPKNCVVIFTSLLFYASYFMEASFQTSLGSICGLRSSKPNQCTIVFSLHHLYTFSIFFLSFSNLFFSPHLINFQFGRFIREFLVSHCNQFRRCHFLTCY